MDDIAVVYINAYGKKWILVQSSMLLQCAYCIFVQPLVPIRDSTGLVVALQMRKEDESHNDGCPQSNEKVSDDTT